MKNTVSRQRSRTTSRPLLESLETRLTPTTYTVSSLADSGPGTLRAAITSVDADTTPDGIDFSVAGVIQLTSGPLPAITNTVTIDGTTAPGFSSSPVVEINNNGFAGLTISGSSSSLVSLSVVNASGSGVTLEGSAAVLVGNYIGLALDGSAAGNQGDGIAVFNSVATIGGTAAGAGNVISGNALNGIVVQDPSTSGTVIEGNFIGTNAAGTAAIANQQSGVLVQTAGATTIGGLTSGTGNVISGNQNDGIQINGLLTPPQLAPLANGGTGLLAAGAYYYVVTATTPPGETTASNEQTITLPSTGAVNLDWSEVGGATSYKIYRGTAAGQENVLVATVYAPATTFTDTGSPTTAGTSPLTSTAVLTNLAPSTIEGNMIGTDATGTVALGNVFDGINVTQAAGTTIGGTTAAARNIISGNGGLPDSGVGVDLIGASTSGTVIEGNYIGTDSSGSQRLGNNSNGIYLQGAVNNTIGGSVSGAGNVISSNASIDAGEAGISLINKANNNTIEGNLIGTDAMGRANLGNGGAGIILDTGSSNNTIGGTTAAERNIISGNGFGPFGPDAGISIGGTAGTDVDQYSQSNVVEGNFIGVDVTGATALGNCLAGVAILTGSDSNTIGGTAAGAGNVIPGNSGEVGSGIFGDGVILTGDNLENQVLGNQIGVDVTGQVAVPNAGAGVYIFQGAFDNQIGATGAGNIISGNGLSGILVQDYGSSANIVGNTIGLNAAGAAALPNQRYGVEVISGAGAYVGGNTISGNLLGGVNVNSFFPPPLLGRLTQGFGGTLPAGTYYYVVTTTTTNGESTPSAERSITLSQPGAVVLNWGAIDTILSNSSVTGYKIYRGTAPGAENVLVADVQGNASDTYTDAGGATTPGSPPQTNTALDVDAAGATLEDNTIGLNAAGTAAIPNPVGVIDVQGSLDVGSYSAGTGNVISGNQTDGVVVSGSKAVARVDYNFIGTASDGHTPFPNGDNGVVFESGAGGSSVSTNVIQNEPQDGVLVETGSINVSITSNSIFNNGNLGIELQPGANENLPAPVVDGAYVEQGNTIVYGHLTGPASTIVTVQIFASPSAPSTGPGQGLTYLQGFNVVTAASGNTIFSVTIANSNLTGQYLTATSTVVPSSIMLEPSYLVPTSEFSAGVAAVSNALASLTIVMYQDVLGRPASPSDIAFWEGQLASGVSRTVMAQALWESPEHRAIEVHQYFEQYLERAPFPGDLTYWVGQMQSGLNEIGMQLALVTSPEYTTNPLDPELSHPTITDYINGLYADVFNRIPSQAELQGWLAAAAAGFSRDQIAIAFLTSPEAYENLLNTYYSEYLHRAPDAAGANYFLNALATGQATEESVAVTILGSDEFFALASGG
ncbi:MAG TPA: DUF4214 domain-containing protein [Gemmataceae bacterium]|jgi:hypothetical protein|nr:DUF4214 domain-containing protein [Gemmataceae bacterium]